ncbi:MAG TPA: DUF2905 domain-containing protein [Burkholderiales bacterium]|nr:DUF2905 domain-containing protein [Burkholderiales bacterium]
MVKWVLTLVLALAILSIATPLFGRVSLGRLPGDFRIPLGGRVLYIPLASTLLLSFFVWLIGRIL